jgi:hypothetical protein
MANRVDAAEDPVEAARIAPPRDRASAQSALRELIVRDQAFLPLRDARDRGFSGRNSSLLRPQIWV